MLDQPRRKTSLINKKVAVGAIAMLAVIAMVGAVFYYSTSSPSASLVQMQLQEQEFKAFMYTHNKQYESEQEYQKRFLIFREKAAYIRAFNKLGKNWTLGLNKFSDLTSEEFKQLYLPFKFPRNPGPFTAHYTGAEVPTSIDWRDEGAVTSVKDQGQCGSCWAFSTAQGVEGAWAIAGHTLVSLSEQQLVDCSRSYGNYGCNGGLMVDGYKYVKAHGLTSEQDYPYKARDEHCKKHEVSNVVATITKYDQVNPDDKDALIEAISGRPVSVAVEADQNSFQDYTSGVITEGCGTNLDHGVLAVGYDTTADPPYYIVKNSWGSSWGENGYLKIKIESGEGVCGIQMTPSYPTS